MEDYIQNDALKHSNDFMQLPQFGTFLLFFFFFFAYLVILYISISTKIMFIF